MSVLQPLESEPYANAVGSSVQYWTELKEKRRRLVCVRFGPLNTELQTAGRSQMYLTGAMPGLISLVGNLN